MNTKLPIIFAEVKPHSPSKSFVKSKSWDELYEIAKMLIDKAERAAFSIHTNPIWEGSPDLIDKVRAENPNALILAKGLHRSNAEVKEMIARGADYVLTVDFIPSVHEDKCLVEMSDLEDLLNVPQHFSCVWNGRDLKAQLEGRPAEKRIPFEEVRKLRAGNLVQASNLMTIYDIDPGADAVIVGRYLETFVQSFFFSRALSLT